MVDPGSVIRTICFAKSIVDFIESGHFVESLIGDITLEAAQQSLIDAQKTQSKRGYDDHINHALGQLKISSKAYWKVIEETESTHFIVMRMSPQKALKLRLIGPRFHYVSCLIATCYAYLREKELCASYLKKAFLIDDEASGVYSLSNSHNKIGTIAGKIGGMGRDPFFNYFKALHSIDFTDLTSEDFRDSGVNDLHPLAQYASIPHQIKIKASLLRTCDRR